MKPDLFLKLVKIVIYVVLNLNGFRRKGAKDETKTDEQKRVEESIQKEYGH